MTIMADLTAFISARLSEDEAMAQLAAREGGTWTQDDPERRPGAISSTGGPVVYDEGSPDEYQAAHIARHDPARVLREVTAKCDVLVIHHLQIIRQEATPFNPYTGEPNEPAYDGNCETCGWFSPGHGGCPTLRAIAAVWSDHPGYRPEWAPGL